MNIHAAQGMGSWWERERERKPERERERERERVCMFVCVRERSRLFLRNRMKRGFCRNSGLCGASPVREFCILLDTPPRYMPVRLGGKHFTDSLREKETWNFWKRENREMRE